MIRSISSSSDPLMPAMRQLIRDFLAELPVDLQYQAVEEELAQRRTTQHTLSTALRMRTHLTALHHTPPSRHTSH